MRGIDDPLTRRIGPVALLPGVNRIEELDVDLGAQTFFPELPYAAAGEPEDCAS